MLREYLEPVGYQMEMAENGVCAWEMLNRSPEKYRAVLLDRIMPEMDGMEVLAKMKNHGILKNLPVIMQTASRESHEIREGIQAGAYYYLTKPYSKEAVRLITAAAVDDFTRYTSLVKRPTTDLGGFPLALENRYHFRTLEEAQILSTLLSRECPSPENAASGLWELMINAVEHGNLGITYAEKSQLIEEGIWEEEIRRRFTISRYAARKATAILEKSGGEIRFRVKDEGDGFDWLPYLEISPERAFDTHGRGIAMSRHKSFHRLEYMGNGNEVVAAVKL
jgi:CheY-like chemotaxis protein